MKVVGIIPARYGSTRFPGKPLAELSGKPMIQWVYENASLCKEISDVIVATDDDRIAAAVSAFGGKCIMTGADHPSGTDRCREALEKSKITCDLVINIQGDEPMIDPLQLKQLISCFENSSAGIATLISKVKSLDELNSEHVVKVVVDKNGKALFFSRAVIPHFRGKDQTQQLKNQNYFKHLGLYAFRPQILKVICDLPPSALEMTESLEQLRWLENGYPIQTALTEIESYPVDTPADLKAIAEKLANKS